MKISWLPSELIPAGRLGLTHSPGAQRRTRDQDLRSLQSEGVAHVVCLQEAFELRYGDREEESIQDREQAVNNLGMRFTHFPIPDHGVGSLSEFRELITSIRSDLKSDKCIILHCYAGLGRAGTTAACVLVADGMSPSAAILNVREARPGAIQSAAQEEFILSFSAQEKAAQ